MNVPTRFPLVFAMLGMTALVSCTQNDGKLNEDTVPAACTGPVANAGPDQSVAHSTLVTLDGSGSALCDETAPGYVWTLESVPTDSTIDAGDVSLTDPAPPTFTPDAVGAFVFSLVVTDAGLLAIGIEPLAMKAGVASRGGVKAQPEVKHPTLRTGTKQALLIAMLQRPDGATIAEIIAATGWQAHSARGAMSGALGKKLGLAVVSAKEDARGRVYRIGQPA